MSQSKVILLLGTNLGSKKGNLETAKEIISNEIGTLIKESNVLISKAEGFTSDNLFLNQKIEVSTNYSPFVLLKKIKDIEKKMGRIYEKPKLNESYTDRLIDIDILYFGNVRINCRNLIVPHHQNFSRKFINDLVFS